jgi:hypothetical protein
MSAERGAPGFSRIGLFPSLGFLPYRAFSTLGFPPVGISLLLGGGRVFMIEGRKQSRRWPLSFGLAPVVFPPC